MILLLEIHYLLTQSTILMIDQQIGEGMIWLPLKVLKSIYLLLPMVLVRSFLTKPIFFLILLDMMTLSWQTNLTGFHPFLHPHCYHKIVFGKFTQHEKCTHSELFWYGFSRIRTEYGEILLNLVRENTDQSSSEYWHFWHSVSLKISTLRHVKV